MSGYISYNATVFVPPKEIDNAKYSFYKNQLEINPYYEIGSESESFNSKFRGKYIGILVGIIGAILTYIVDHFFKTEISEVGGILFGLIAIFNIYYLVLEGTSYSTFLNEKSEYLLKLKYSIIISENFFEFYKVFYTNHSSLHDSQYKLWKKSYFKNPKRNSA